MGLNDYLQVGTRIKQARQQTGLSQKEFAKIVDIPVATYSNYENNRRVPGKDNLKKIAAALGVPESSLLGMDSPAALQQTTSLFNFMLSIGYEIYEHPYDRHSWLLYDHNTNSNLELTDDELNDIENSVKELINKKILSLTNS